MHYPYNNKKEVLKTDKANGNLLASTNSNDIVELFIDHDGLIPAHALPIDVTFYVIKGSGAITIDNETIAARQGDVIEVKRGLERSWHNQSTESLKLLVIKQKQ